MICFYDKFKEIFEFYDQIGIILEVEVGCIYIVFEIGFWFFFVGKVLKGVVQCVIFQDQVVCFDGVVVEGFFKGKDMFIYGVMFVIVIIIFFVLKLFS